MPKGRPAKLGNRETVTYTERKRAEEMLAHNAFHDGLNWPAESISLCGSFAHALTSPNDTVNYNFAVLLIDVDEIQN